MLGASDGGLASAVWPAPPDPAEGVVGGDDGRGVPAEGGAGGPGGVSRGRADGSGAGAGGAGASGVVACGTGSGGGGALAICLGGSGGAGGAFAGGAGFGGCGAGFGGAGLGGGAAGTLGLGAGGMAARGAGGGGPGGTAGFPSGAFSSGFSGAMSTMSGSPRLAYIGEVRVLTQTNEVSSRMWSRTDRTTAMANARRAGSSGNGTLTGSDYAMPARRPRTGGRGAGLAGPPRRRGGRPYP
jgi:hypothetical protein